MTDLTTTDFSVVIDTKDRDLWCVFEHYATLEANAPPVIILVGATPLSDVYNLSDGRANSEWIRIFKDGGQIMVRVIATGKRQDCVKHAFHHMKSLDPMPVCNMRGVNLRGRARQIRDQDGNVFRTQREASMALGVSQSAISQHLDGRTKTVAGRVLMYDYE